MVRTIRNGASKIEAPFIYRPAKAAFRNGLIKGGFPVKSVKSSHN
jgi:hypothetical protein